MHVERGQTSVIVEVTEDEIREFNSGWPGSNLRGLEGVSFEFALSNGDLIDIAYANGDTEEWDGEALLALSRDAQDAAGLANAGHHRPNARLGDREQFRAGFDAGTRDRQNRRERPLCSTRGTSAAPPGALDPVVKSDNHSFYHGYKAGSEGAGSEPGAWVQYQAKHRRASGVMAANGDRAILKYRIEETGHGTWEVRRSEGGAYERLSGTDEYGESSKQAALALVARDAQGRRHSVAEVTYDERGFPQEHSPNSRGIYHETGASDGDYVIRSHRDQLYVDRVGRGGTHTTIGSTRGFPTLKDAARAIEEDAHREDNESGLVLVQGPDELFQMGSLVKRSHSSPVRFEGGGGETLDQLEGFVMKKLARNPAHLDLDGHFDFGIGTKGEHAKNARRPAESIGSGYPKVRIYDAGEGSGMDRYTAVIVDPDWGANVGHMPMLGFGPGIDQFSEGQEGRHLGRRISFTSLPENMQRVVLRRLAPEHAKNARRPAESIGSGYPKVRIYDAGEGSGMDRYTAVIVDPDWGANVGHMPMLGFGPGIDQFSEGQEGRHLGRRISFTSLPENMQRVVLRRLAPEHTANARKNITEILDAFRAGRAKGGDTCSTDGDTVYSYALPIASRIHGDVVVLDLAESPSRTTSSRIRAVMTEFPGARKVQHVKSSPGWGEIAAHRTPLRSNASAGADERRARAWMEARASEFEDRKTGEVNYTALAEAAANEVGHNEWLDDETHPVWDWAVEAGEGHELARYGYTGNARRGQFKTPPGLTPSEAFFFEQAGSSYPVGSTPAQQKRAKVDGAKALAAAEAEATARGWECEWEEDSMADTSWMNEEQTEAYQSGRLQMLEVLLKDDSGDVLASLCGVATYDARNDPIIRLTEAELALEALHNEREAGKAMALNRRS